MYLERKDFSNQTGRVDPCWRRRAESFLKQRARKLPPPSPKRALPQRPRDFFGPALQGLCAVVLAAKSFLEQRAREIFGGYCCKGFLFHCCAEKLPRAAFWKKLPQGLSCPVLERQRKARSDVMSCRCSATSSSDSSDRKKFRASALLQGN